MKRSLLILLIYSVTVFCCCDMLAQTNVRLHNESSNIVIENNQMKLIIGCNGKSKSLIHKGSGQECLNLDADLSISSLTEYRPYDNELFLTYPAKARTFQADTAYLDNGILKVGFEDIAYEASISFTINDSYIGFKLVKLDYEIEHIGVKRRTEIDEFVLLQLPIKKREFFGEWLNVVWDDAVAINLLATDIYGKIDAIQGKRSNILMAGMENNVKLMNVGAALITTSSAQLLDCIDQVEKDYELPRGVESRRRKEYAYSYYELRNVNTQNIDEHIQYAQQGGFKTMVIYYTDFSAIVGHFPWRKEYPNKMADLKLITDKIKAAGIIPGIHIHYNKAHIRDAYVSPVPDARLNLVRTFTLAKAMNSADSVLFIEENPENCTLEKNRKMLKIGKEVVSYESYTTEPPYQFVGCKRGVWGSKVQSSEKGDKFGLLDVDTWPDFVRLDQNTSIQQELAEKLGHIYKDAGFQFVYFDGAEDVHPPYWHNVSKSQYLVYKNFNPSPLFSEGAIKSHFGWHILSRGNAFDLFKPEDIRKATQKYPMKAAKYIAQDFTSINFGWNDYLAPNDKTIGMQPDMYEYICSRGAAWNCPIALMGKLDELKSHPRTTDNLEVIKNWEEARISNFLSDEQKMMLKSATQEHILFKNEKNKFELLPYEEIKEISQTVPDIRAFIFYRNNQSWVVFWHVRSDGVLTLPLTEHKVQLFDKVGGKAIKIKRNANNIVIPVDKRRYLALDMPMDEAKKWISQLDLSKNNLLSIK